MEAVNTIWLTSDNKIGIMYICAFWNKYRSLCLFLMTLKRSYFIFCVCCHHVGDEDKEFKLHIKCVLTKREQCRQNEGLILLVSVNVWTKPILQFCKELAFVKYSIISSRLILKSLGKKMKKRKMGALPYCRLWQMRENNYSR